MFECEDDITGKEFYSGLIKPLAILKMEEELSSRAVVKHHE